MGYNNNMETKSNIFKDFFTKQEESLLRNLVEANRMLEPNSSRFAPMIIKSMSRQQIEFVVPEDIKEKLLNLAKQFVDDPDLELTHYQYLDYYGKYGEGQSPNLPPHLDTENYYTKVSIDYQMSSNIDWAIVVEDEKFILKDNEVLVFEASERIHWRDPIILKENDRCEVIVFHFSNKFDHQPYAEKQMNKEERNIIIEKHNNIPRMKIYREKFFKELEEIERKNGGARKDNA
jgi:hypothetical protein